MGRRAGIVGILVALRDGIQALAHQGQEVGFYLVGIPAITEAVGDLFVDAIPLTQLMEQKTTDIGGAPADLKIGRHFLSEKAFKKELIMVGWFTRVSWLKSGLRNDNSMLSDTLCFLSIFRE